MRSERADAQVRALLGRVLAQKRSVGVALDYVTALAPGDQGELLGARRSGRPRGLGPDAGPARAPTSGTGTGAARAAARAGGGVVSPDPQEDLIGPGIAIDETAQLKHGESARRAWRRSTPGCTGQVENCVTTVFSALRHRLRAGLGSISTCTCRTGGPADLQPGGVTPGSPVASCSPPSHSWRWTSWNACSRPGCPPCWAAFDEVYGRSPSKLPQAGGEGTGLAYVAIIPVRLPGHPALRHGHPGRRGGEGRGVRAALVRKRVQGTPLQRTGR